MKVLKAISGCHECDWLHYIPMFGVAVCNQMPHPRKKFDIKKGIPDWCPLDTCQETTNAET